MTYDFFYLWCNHDCFYIPILMTNCCTCARKMTAEKKMGKKKKQKLVFYWNWCRNARRAIKPHIQCTIISTFNELICSADNKNVWDAFFFSSLFIKQEESYTVIFLSFKCYSKKKNVEWKYWNWAIEYVIPSAVFSVYDFVCVSFFRFLLPYRKRCLLCKHSSPNWHAYWLSSWLYNLTTCY